jgi:hypothetical protein
MKSLLLFLSQKKYFLLSTLYRIFFTPLLVVYHSSYQRVGGKSFQILHE